MVIDVDLPTAQELVLGGVGIVFGGVAWYHIVMGGLEFVIRRLFGLGPDWLERERYHDARYDRLESLILERLAATSADGAGGGDACGAPARAGAVPLGNTGTTAVEGQ